MKSTSLVITAISFLFIVACSKKENTLSKTEMLTSGTWKNTAVMYDNDGNGTYEFNDFATLPPCFTDAFWSFGASSVVTIDEGPTKCNPADRYRHLAAYTK
jgi:hypothetical protein